MNDSFSSIKHPVSTNHHDARKTALIILNTLDKQRKTLDGVIKDVLVKDPPFSRKDQALLYALIYGVLRWRGKLDWIIAQFSETRLDKIDPMVLNILRLGLFQIVFLNKVPASAAVNTSVEMVKHMGQPWIVGYVNALLRNVVRGYKKISFPDIEKDTVAALSVNKSFPKWIIKRWLDRFGYKETVALCDSINSIPPITIRTNTLKTTCKKLKTNLKRDVEKIENTNYSTDGICFFHPKRSIPEMKAFKNGWFQVQDEGAQLVTQLLNPRPGETVLDACSGLGGKTGHIAQMMKNIGTIIALDNHEKKLLSLESEMRRLGVSIVSTYTHDLNNPLNIKPLGMFDRILVDAPCSGLGVLRRNPDAKWFTSENNLARYKEKQIKFLDNLAHILKPSGVLVYSVCSTELEENEEVIKTFQNMHSEFIIDNNLVGFPPQIHSLINKDGYLKTYPHINNMDGFFSVCLKRIK